MCPNASSNSSAPVNWTEKNSAQQGYCFREKEHGQNLSGHYGWHDSWLLHPFHQVPSCLRRSDDSKSLCKKMNIDPNNNIAQSYLLGQLGRADYSYKGMGADLLEDAMDIIKQVNEMVGCRVVRVDCLDELIPYYEQHGFRFLCVTDPTDDKPPINQMIQII